MNNLFTRKLAFSFCFIIFICSGAILSAQVGNLSVSAGYPTYVNARNTGATLTIDNPITIGTETQIEATWGTAMATLDVTFSTPPTNYVITLNGENVDVTSSFVMSDNNGSLQAASGDTKIQLCLGAEKLCSATFDLVFTPLAVPEPTLIVTILAPTFAALMSKRRKLLV